MRHRDALATAGATSQVTALSLLVSMYLQSVYAASSEEIEIFLSPVASRSRVREAVRGLSATRQIHSLSMDAQTYYFLEDGLPEFAEPAAPTAVGGPSAGSGGSGKGRGSSAALTGAQTGPASEANALCGANASCWAWVNAPCATLGSSPESCSSEFCSSGPRAQAGAQTSGGAAIGKNGVERSAPTRSAMAAGDQAARDGWAARRERKAGSGRRGASPLKQAVTGQPRTGTAREPRRGVEAPRRGSPAGETTRGLVRRSKARPTRTLGAARSRVSVESAAPVLPGNGVVPPFARRRVPGLIVLGLVPVESGRGSGRA